MQPNALRGNISFTICLSELLGDEGITAVTAISPRCTAALPIISLPAPSEAIRLMTSKQQEAYQSFLDEMNIGKFFEDKIAVLKLVNCMYRNLEPRYNDAEILLRDACGDLIASSRVCSSNDDFEALLQSFDTANDFQDKVRNRLTNIFNLPETSLIFCNPGHPINMSHLYPHDYNYTDVELRNIGGVSFPVYDGSRLRKYAVTFVKGDDANPFRELLTSIHELSHCKERDRPHEHCHTLNSILKEGDQKVMEYEILRKLLQDQRDAEFSGELRSLIGFEWHLHCQKEDDVAQDGVANQISIEEKLREIYSTHNKSALSNIYRFERDFTLKIMDLSSEEAIRDFHYNEDATRLRSGLREGLFDAIDETFRFCEDNCNNFSVRDLFQRSLVIKLVEANFLPLLGIENRERYLAKLQETKAKLVSALEIFDSQLAHCSMARFNHICHFACMNIKDLHVTQFPALISGFEDFMQGTIDEASFRKKIILCIGVDQKQVDTDTTADEESFDYKETKAKADREILDQINTFTDEDIAFSDTLSRDIDRYQSSLDEGLDTQKSLFNLQFLVNCFAYSHPHDRKRVEQYMQVRQRSNADFRPFHDKATVKYEEPIALTPSLWLVAKGDLPTIYQDYLKDIEARYFLIDTNSLNYTSVTKRISVEEALKLRLGKQEAEVNNNQPFNFEINTATINNFDAETLSQEFNLSIIGDQITIEPGKLINIDKEQFSLQSRNSGKVKDLLGRKFEELKHFNQALPVGSAQLKERVRTLRLYTHL